MSGSGFCEGLPLLLRRPGSGGAGGAREAHARALTDESAVGADRLLREMGLPKCTARCTVHATYDKVKSGGYVCGWVSGSGFGRVALPEDEAEPLGVPGVS